MHRSIALLICSAMLLVGCAKMNEMTTKSPPMSMADPKKPSQPVQMKQLEPFIGSWEGTAEVVPPAGSPAATQPVKTSKGSGTSEWTLDGMAMKSTGWHDMPNDQKQTYVEYVSWDASARKFRSYYVSDWGDSGTGWMWADPSGQTFHWTAKGMNAHGQSSSMSGSSTLAGNNTMTWTFVEHGPTGRMEMKGTSKRTGAGATK